MPGAPARAFARACRSSMDQPATVHRRARGGPLGCHDASIRGVVCSRIRDSAAGRISGVPAVRRRDRPEHDPFCRSTSEMTNAIALGDLLVNTGRRRAKERERAVTACTICTNGQARNDHTCGCRSCPGRHPGTADDSRCAEQLSAHRESSVPAGAGRRGAQPRRPSPALAGRSQAAISAVSTSAQLRDAADRSTASSTNCTCSASVNDGAGSWPVATASIRSRISWVNECS